MSLPKSYFRTKLKLYFRSKPKCWNCDGDHMLTECKLPRNQHKINENKQAFMSNAQQQQPTGPK